MCWKGWSLPSSKCIVLRGLLLISCNITCLTGSNVTPQQICRCCLTPDCCHWSMPCNVIQSWTHMVSYVEVAQLILWLYQVGRLASCSCSARGDTLRTHRTPQVSLYRLDSRHLLVVPQLLSLFCQFTHAMASRSRWPLLLLMHLPRVCIFGIAVDIGGYVVVRCFGPLLHSMRVWLVDLSMAGKLCVAIDYHGTLRDLLKVSKLGSRRRLTQLAVVLRFVVRV